MLKLNRALEQTLQSWQKAGLSWLPREENNLLDQLRQQAQAGVSVASEPHGQEKSSPQSESRSLSDQENPTPNRDTQNTEELPTETKSMNSPEKEQKLNDLSRQVATCQKCAELAAGRTQTVFGIGNSDATVMFIGEAPGADEDKQGEPFVGRAGKLLTTIIEACGWKREEIYICNILRCRPPGNRNPTPVEAENCREFLDEQINIVDPGYIVCWGTIAAQNLLNEKTPIGRLRGEFHQYKTAKVLCTYHPAYLLRNPPAKKFVWEDLKILLNEMGIDPDNITRKK